MMAKYFTDSEFACNHCGELPENGMNTKLVEALDKLREMWGRPIYVSSGYRCQYHNANVGGVWNSQHVQGNACDIWTDGDYETFYQFVLNSHLFSGIGHYPYNEFVHVDMRDDNINYYLWEG